MSEAGDTAVTAVKNHREEDRNGGNIKVPGHGLNNRVKRAEKRRRRKKVRQNEDAPRADNPDIALSDFGKRNSLTRDVF